MFLGVPKAFDFHCTSDWAHRIVTIIFRSLGPPLLDLACDFHCTSDWAHRIVTIIFRSLRPPLLDSGNIFLQD